MAGLLDNYGTDPLGMGLLQAGAALMTPRAYGGGVAGGLLGFNQGAMQAMQMRRQLEQDARRNKLVDAQTEELIAQAAERKRATSAAEAKQQGLQSILTDIAGRSQPQFDFRAASAAANAGQPYAPAAPQGPTITQTDVLKWAALGGDPKQLEAIVASKDWGLAKVKDYVTMAGPNGPRKQGMDEFGRKVGDGFDEPVKYDMVNLGDRVVPVNQYVPPTSPLKIGQSPDSRASVGAQYARLGLDRERFNWEKTQPQLTALDTSQGPVLIDKRSAAATPVTVGGVPIPPKPPESARTNAQNIDAELSTIRSAIADVKKTPTAFSMERGMATMAGSIPESVRGRMDSAEERKARAFVFNVVSKSINERAGAAQSAQELARLRSFLPAETDDAQQVQDKLAGYEQYLLERRKGFEMPGIPPAPGGSPSAPTGGFDFREAARQELERRQRGGK